MACSLLLQIWGWEHIQVGRLAGLSYDIHVEMDVGWGDIGIEEPYIMIWGRDYEPQRWHPHIGYLTYYRLVFARMRP